MIATAGGILDIDAFAVGPVCWEKCPVGWIDEGALCREKGHIKTIAKKTYGMLPTQFANFASFAITCSV